MQNNGRLTNSHNNDLQAEILQLASGTKIEQRVQDALQKPNADIWDIYVCVVNNTAKDRRDDLYEFNSRIFESQLNSPTQPQEQLVQPQLTSDPKSRFPYLKSTDVVQQYTQLQEQPDSGTGGTGGTKRSRTEAFGNETENPTDGVTEPPIAKRFHL